MPLSDTPRPRHPPLMFFGEAYLATIVGRAADGLYSDRDRASLRARIPGFDNLVWDEKARREAEAFHRRLAEMDAAEAADRAFQAEMTEYMAAQAAAADMLAISIEMSRLPLPHRDAVLRVTRVEPGRYAAAENAIALRHRIPESYTCNGPDRARRDSDVERGRRAALADAHRDAVQVMRILEAFLGEMEPLPNEVSAAGRRLAIGDEGEIHEVAQQEAERWQRLLRMRGPTYDALADYEVRELSCPQYHKRKLRRESLRAQAFYDSALRMCGSRRPAVSTHTLEHWEERQRRAAEWARLRVIEFSDGQQVSMTDVQASSREGRRARLYAVTKGIERLAERHGYVALFLTITLPGRYHPTTTDRRGVRRSNPNWTSEFGPKAQRTELNRIWQHFRARIAKLPELRGYFGVRVPEPHEDGTPHLHIMMYVPAWVMRGEARRPTVNVLRRKLREASRAEDGTTEARRQTKVVLVDKAEGGASPASYIMKYILKSLGGGVAADESGDVNLGEMAEAAQESNAHRAWLSSRGIRGFQFLGAHGFQRILQKLATISDEELDDAAPLARTVATHLAEMRAWGEVAARAEDDENRADARRRQTDAVANALHAAGMLRGLHGDAPRLRLAYERAETTYGRPTKRAMGISEPGPDKRFGRRRTAKTFDDEGRLVSWSVRGGEQFANDDPRHAAHTIRTTLVTHLKPLVPAAYGQGTAGEDAEIVDEDGCVTAGRRVRITHAPRGDERPGRFKSFTVHLAGDDLAAALAGRLVVIPAHRRQARIVDQKEFVGDTVTVSAIYPSAAPAGPAEAANDPGGGPRPRRTYAERVAEHIRKAA